VKLRKSSSCGPEEGQRAWTDLTDWLAVSRLRQSGSTGGCDLGQGLESVPSLKLMLMLQPHAEVSLAAW
jgi:hypothetical protein